MAAIELQGLVKRYGKTQVVHGIDLTIEDGEFVVFVGPSGCGKSTTLRMIAGLEEIDGGTISIGGRAVNRLEPKERNIAMVFQNYAIYPHMSVAENIGFGLYTAKLDKAEKRRRVGVSRLTPKRAVSPANTGSQCPGRIFRCARLRHVCSSATPLIEASRNVSRNPSESV